MSCEADSLDWPFVRSAVAVVECYKHARFNPKTAAQSPYSGCS